MRYRRFFLRKIDSFAFLCYYCVMKNNFPDKSVVLFDKKKSASRFGLSGATLNRYSSSSPYPDEDVSFNWLACEYPYLHYHDYFEILVITGGEVINDLNGVTYEMHGGDACLIRPNDRHRLLAGKNAEVGQQLNFLIKTDYAEKLLENYCTGITDELLKHPDALNFKISAEYITKLTNTCLGTQSTKISVKDKTLQCKIIVCRLINSFMDKRFSILPAYPEWFQRLLSYLNDPHSDMSVEDLAKTTSYSYSRLSRIFKDLMGIGIIEYARNIKMDYAAEMLKNTDKPVTRIVEELNYSSISYFNRAFKETFGITPTQMRKPNV